MERRNGPLTVALVGGSGAGKSTIAQAAVRALTQRGVTAHVVAEDDFYHPRDRFPSFDAASHNFDEPAAKDTDLLADVLRLIRAGAEARAPRYDFVVHDRAGWRTLPKADVLLFEGLHLLCTPELRSLFDLSVYIQAAAASRFGRRLTRDVAERGRTEEGVRAQFETLVAPMHAQWVKPQRAFADLVITNDGSCPTALELAAEPLVAGVLARR